MSTNLYYQFWIPFWGFFQTIFGFSLVLGIISVVALWMIYQKAGEEGWAAIIPFYKCYVLYKITWGSGWYFLLLFVPFANVVIHIITMVKLANAFGKGGGWACGLIFLNPIFLCIMAFDKTIVYVGEYPGYGFNSGTAQSGYTNSSQQQSSYNAANYRTSTNSSPKYCSNCGSPVSEGDKFCLHCGQPL